jgi:hypothetical protein
MSANATVVAFTVARAWMSEFSGKADHLEITKPRRRLTRAVWLCAVTISGAAAPVHRGRNVGMIEEVISAMPPITSPNGVGAGNWPR